MGSIAQRKPPSRAHPFVSGAVQQFATGIVYSIPALSFRHALIDGTRGIGAIFYLMIFGSMVGYSAFSFAMDRLPVAIASIYTYVNPMVAVLLGWSFISEPFGMREAIAMAIIFIGVAMVKRASVPPIQKLSPESAAESGQYGE